MLQTFSHVNFMSLSFKNPILTSHIVGYCVSIASTRCLAIFLLFICVYNTQTHRNGKISFLFKTDDIDQRRS